jgi:putative selenium metabolism hydrolase
MAIADQIRSLAEQYADETAANLARLVQTRSYGGEEGDVLRVIEELCTTYNFDEVRYDGLGNLLARVGNGPKSIAFDGHMEMKVHFKGVSCHGSAPERGVNASYKAARTILALEELNEKLPPDDDGFLGKGTVVVSQTKAHGPSQCAVPDMAELYLDRRLTWGETKEFAIQQVMEAGGGEIDSVEVPHYTNTSWKGTTYGQELYFPTWKIEADHPLVKAGVAAYQNLYSNEPVVDKWTFSTNGVSICGLHKVPLIGFGPGDEDQAHAPNERLRVADLPVAVAFYASLVHTLP